MSLIEKALYRLDRAVGSLEGSMGALETSMKGKQRDMFAQADAPKNLGRVQSQVIARRLDKAIERVEQLLGEAA
ncbi:MAG: hypothetical protein L6Q57_00435 [Alphaproteobacteria bacterium]|nr:hypothetical protein [Alphaproteobacteria bacterium]